MKKLIIVLMAVVCFASTDIIAKGPFNKDASDLNIGIGLGSTLYGDQTIPPISASYEVGFPWGNNEHTKKMSIGGYAGFSQTSYDWYYGEWSYTYIILGARVAYHFYNEGDLDAYGGLMLGYNIVNSSYTSKLGYDDFDYSAGASSGIETSAFVGARYYFTPNFGVFGELGYGIAWLTLGVTLKM